MDKIIALGAPSFGEEELAAVKEVLDSGWVAGQGPVSKKFEAEFADRCGTKHALAVNNCTAALHLAFLGLGLQPGDEVVVADYTFPATGHAVMFCGGVPVFADVRPDIWTIDPASVESRITSRTVGIVAVDVAGQPADYDELQAIARRHGLWLVEDAAAAAGATYRGRPSGSLADVACFSFHGRKGITCGEGGALTSDRTDLVDHARKIHAFGIESALTRASGADLPVPEFDELGYNYKLSEIAAAIVRVQLGRLDDLSSRRRSTAEAYRERFTGWSAGRFTMPIELPDRTSVWQSYLIELDPTIDRGLVARYLRERGVQCNFGTYASHRQPLYSAPQDCPVSARVFDHHLALPMHPNLTEDDLDRVNSTLMEAISNTRSGSAA